METEDASTNDLFWEFDELCEFPWPNAPFVDLKRYVRSVYEFLPHVSSQQEVRLQARVRAESDPVAIGEFKSEIELVRNSGSIVLPRVIWGGVLVSIYSAYEFGVESVLHYWRQSTNNLAAIKFEPKRDFLKCAEDYTRLHLGIPLFVNDRQRTRLNELRTLRNSFVRRGSRFSTLPRKLQAAISSKEHSGLSLDESDGQWIANARSAAFYLLMAERAIKTFGDEAVEKCLASKGARRKAT